MKEALNPHISIDCVVFGFDFSELKVLFVERKFKSEDEKLILNDLKLRQIPFHFA